MTSILSQEQGQENVAISQLKHGLSCIGNKHVFLRLCLASNNIHSLTTLSNFIHIQKLQVPNNNLTSFDGLDCFRNLITIDVSNNSISNLLFTNPPSLVKELDASRNLLSAMSDLSCFRFLKHLSLDFNNISSITGLEKCSYLTHLSLSNNQIDEINCLENLPLTHINLSSNQLQSLGGLATLSQLLHLDVSNNLIDSIQANENNDWDPDNHKYLQTLNLSNNKLVDTEEIASLASLRYLRNLNLDNNKLQAIDTNPSDRVMTAEFVKDLHNQNSACLSDIGNRLFIVYILSQLSIFNGLNVTPEEKIAALNRYEPSIDVQKSIQHSCTIQKRFSTYSQIKTVNSNGDKKVVVVCGSTGVGKRTLIARLLKEYPALFGHAISHTTRKPRSGEVDGVNYYFCTRSDMKSMISKNEFIEVVEMFGNFYATTFKSIDDVTQQGKICILDVELKGVVALLSKINPLTIFIAAPSVETISERLTLRKQNEKMKSNQSSPSSTPSSTPTTPSTDLLKKDSGVDEWIGMAQDSFNESEHDFDLRVVNDDLDTCYKTISLKMLGWYWDSYEKNNN